MNLLELINKFYIQKRRASRICYNLLEFLPSPTGSPIHILDIGSGSGLIASYIQNKRPDIIITGCDISLRKDSFIKINQCPINKLPYKTASFDGALLIDSLHHNENPQILLEEAKRVSRDFIVIKDHLLQGRFSRVILKFMDRVGNLRFNVALPYTYWPEEKWLQVFNNLTLRVTNFKKSLKIYPWPLTYIADRSFHFIAKLKLS